MFLVLTREFQLSTTIRLGRFDERIQNRPSKFDEQGTYSH